MLALSVPATATTPDRPSGSAKPTVVLVHGAWADSSSWAPVVERLTRDGYPVRAIANPLQGLTGDSAYLASYLAAIEGPKVLVGHSYGGAVITNAATAVPGVKSPVYVARFIPVQGETIGELASRSASALPLLATRVPGGTEVVIDPAHFRDRFAGTSTGPRPPPSPSPGGRRTPGRSRTPAPPKASVSFRRSPW